MRYNNNIRKSEANIQAEIYHRLKLLNIESCLEYQFKLVYNNKEISVYADIVVIKNNNIICICEVKNYNKDIPNTNGRQYKKYEMLNIPFVYCMNETHIDNVISIISKIHTFS